jgi:hypothetical protein
VTAHPQFYQQLIGLCEDASTLAEHFWEQRHDKVDHKHMMLIRGLRHLGYPKIARLINSSKDLLPELGREEETQVRLGLWLCSFFFGFPLPHLWERVRSLDPFVEGFAPGTGALYDKLAGDVYRSERKSRDRRRLNGLEPPDSPSIDDEPIFVLAFSPTALFPDEDWEPIGEECDDPVRAPFLRHLSRLGGRYLRLQMWLYFDSGYPIRYGFVIDFAARNFTTHSPNFEPERVRRAVTGRLKRMAGKVENLFGLQHNRDGVDKWTSCTYGRHYGVESDAPPTHVRGRQFRWLSTDFLNAGRVKVRQLTEEPMLSAGTTLGGKRAVDELIKRISGA